MPISQAEVGERAEYFRKILRLNEQYPFMVRAPYAGSLLNAHAAAKPSALLCKQESVTLLAVCRILRSFFGSSLH